MKIKAITARNAAYVALVASLCAMSVSAFLALSIDRIVDDAVRDAVVVTKVRIAELEAATRVSVARANFSRTKAYLKLETDLAEISSDLSSVYSGAPSSEGERWENVKQQFDAVIAKAKAKDQSLVADLDALVVTLRSE